MTATSLATAPTRAAERRRVLVFRSCRPAQFAAAVQAVRDREPAAAITALTHRGHRAAVVAAGVDAIAEIPGRRFGLFRQAPWHLLKLRSRRFDEIVIPQMCEYGNVHLNLYSVALVLRPRRVVVVPGDQPALTFDFWAFFRWAATHADSAKWGARVAPLALLVLLGAARFIPRSIATRGDKKRVLHIIPSLGLGGAQRQLAEIVNRTPEHYDVDVLVFDRKDDFAARWLTRSNVRVVYGAPDAGILGSIIDVRRQCLEQPYDVVHTWLTMANILGTTGARLAGVPRIVTSVRSLTEGTRMWLSQWWLRPADALAARAADVVTVNAEALRRDHARWALYPSRRIRVVHNGCDPSKFILEAGAARRRLRELLSADPGTPIIGTVSRLSREKDQRTFLRIVRDVLSTHPTLRAVLIGDGELRADLETCAQALGISEAVTFLGSRSDALSLSAGCDVLVLTSLVEGFPNVLLEAAMLGVPAIATRVGGTPDVLPDPADTFVPGDVATAAARIRTWLDDPRGAHEHAVALRHRALEMFTVDRACDAWLALYDGGSTKERRL